jgi:TRAP-type C4-dicarboxylate transport system permease small subunit
MSDKPSAVGKIVKGMTDFASGIAVFGVLVVVLLQVSSRLVGMPVTWTEEATRYLFVWMIFLGLAAGFRTVETARVTILIAALPVSLHRMAVPVYVVASVVFFVLTGWTGYKLVQQQYMMNETAATLAIPMWMIGIVMPLSAVLAILAIIESLRTRYDLIAIGGFTASKPEADVVVSNMEQKP